MPYLMCLKFHSQTKTPPGSFVTTNAIDFPPFRTPPPFPSLCPPINSCLFYKNLVELILLKADNHIEALLTEMKYVSGFECSVNRHQDTGALSWVSGRRALGCAWPEQQGTNGMFLLPSKKGSQASVLPTELQFPFCFEMLRALSVRAI